MELPPFLSLSTHNGVVWPASCPGASSNLELSGLGTTASSKTQTHHSGATAGPYLPCHHAGLSVTHPSSTHRGLPALHQWLRRWQLKISRAGVQDNPASSLLSPGKKSFQHLRLHGSNCCKTHSTGCSLWLSPGAEPVLGIGLAGSEALATQPQVIPGL